MRKTWFCVLMIPLLLLTACQGSGEDAEKRAAEEAARQVRTQYLAAERCGGTVEVTADYGLRVYEFTLGFQWEREGETVLSIAAPEELAGLTARIAPGESLLEYDGVSLGTGDLTGEGLTPMELLPTVMDNILEGYMGECVFETLNEAETLRVRYSDPEKEAGTGVECVLWFDRAAHGLLRAELSNDGVLVLSGNFSDFYIGDDENDGDQQGQDLGGDQPGEPGA